MKQSAGNADYDIAMSSSALARTKPVVVAGDDTDLLILNFYLYSSISTLLNSYTEVFIFTPALNSSTVHWTQHSLNHCSSSTRYLVVNL